MRHAARALAAAWLACVLACPAPARARDLVKSEDGERWLRLRSALHVIGLVSRAPEDPLLFPDPLSGASFWRLRLEPEARPFPWLTVGAAYEQSLRTVSSSGAGLATGGASLLPSQAPVPFRLAPLDGSLGGESNTFSWRQGLDRAFVAVNLPFAELTVGRQAIGWGRGVLFNAVDLFPPFTPLEVDREWRPGIDAVRLNAHLSDRASLEGVAALGGRTDESAYLTRLRGDLGRLDVELVGGWRFRDWVLGGSASAPVGPAEVHGELAFFALPKPWADGGTFGNDQLVAKAVLGGSYQLGIGQGLRLVLEYHYSGFGVRRAQDVVARLQDPDFRDRYLRGDTQILGRNALALLASYPATTTLSLSLTCLQDPVDGSGVVAPALSWDLSGSVTLLAGVYVAYGATPVGLTLTSQFGYVPLTGLVQIRLYD